MSTAPDIAGGDRSRGGPLLTTKTAAPRIRTPVVDRPRLLQLVSRGVEGLLTVVSGAAGSGKTLLLASWCARTTPPGPVAWLTLEPEDDVPGEFWTYVLASLRRAGAGLPDDVGVPFLAGSVPHDLLARLADALATGATPVVLVLDRFEVVRDPQVHRGLDFVLRHADGNLRLVLLTRDDGARWLRGYELRGEVARVRNGDLAFTGAEAGDLLRRHGIGLPPETLTALTERTHGWAAGLRLSALAMQQRREPAALVAALPGADPTLTGYVVAEVLEAQPPDVRDFLLSTCVVDRVCPALADALTGRAGGEMVLARLQSANVLTTAVEQAPGWYEYHPLLVHVLRGELGRERPGSVEELHRRASTWFDGAGCLVEAVQHAAAAADWPLAAALLVRRLGIGRLLAGREAPQLDAALRGLPATGGGAMLAAVRAARALTACDLDVCREQVGLAEDRAPEEAESDRPLLLASTAVIRALLARIDGDLPAAEAALASGEAQLSRTREAGQHHDLLALLLSSVAAVAFWAGRFDEADRVLRHGLVVSSGPECRYPRLDVLGRLAVLEALRGRLGQAAELGRAAITLADDLRLPLAHRTGTGDLALALVAVEQGDQTAARRHVDHASRSAEARHDPLVASLVPLVKAVGYADHRDVRRALSSLATVPAVVGGRPLPPWLADRLALTSALVHTDRRDAAAATAALDSVGSPSAQLTVRRAALALATGDRGRTAALLSPVLAGDVVDGAGSRIEAWLLAAQLHLVEGSRPLARAALDRALTLARPEGRRRLLLRPGPSGRGLLSAFPDVTGAHAWLGLATPAGSGTPGRTEGPGTEQPRMPVEHLTEREATVLARMAQAMSAEDIANDLVVSVNTVKTHQRGIYRKLAVSRRNDAVRRARSLGLV
ncbi:LuxR C-terminal-related transcriptional regulator [Modestobacter sp. SSW1-42]|uniref:helix-turn-helix transcriptional regulator n=1 Tax=Modestobacter sp. SSW1-42 TaxID=596372 RepID=UPI0039875486